MNILIVGGGKLVYFLCRVFLAKGYTATVINRDHEECVRLARLLKATVVHGDGSDLQILEEAGARTADAILAVTPNDEDNLVICQLGALRFGVQRVLALVSDPDNEDAFRRLGVDAVSTTRILSSLIEQKTGFEDIVNLIPTAEGSVNVTEITLSEDSPVIGKSLRNIGLPENSLVATVLRQGQAIVPRGGTVLEHHDKLLLVTLPENHGQVLKMLTGDAK